MTTDQTPDSQISLILDRYGDVGKLIVDGVDMSDQIGQAFTLAREGAGVPTLTLELMPGRTTYDGPARLRVDDETAAMLARHGWTPPQEQTTEASAKGEGAGRETGTPRRFPPPPPWQAWQQGFDRGWERRGNPDAPLATNPYARLAYRVLGEGQVAVDPEDIRIALEWSDDGSNGTGPDLHAYRRLRAAIKDHLAARKAAIDEAARQMMGAGR